MANVDRPSGFKPVGYLNGAPFQGKTNLYHVSAEDATLIGVGDLVVLDGTGDNATGIRNVTRAAANGVCVGVMVGVVHETPDNLGRNHRPASTAMYVMVADDPNLIMEANEDASTSTIAVAQVGLNFNFIVAAANSTTGMSAMEVDSETGDTTNTLPLRLIGFVRSPDNEFGATATANAKVLVGFNTHQYRSNTGSTGV